MFGTCRLYLCIRNKNKTVMNKENNFSSISSMISSEASYRTLLDLINEMDLELMDISLA